MKKSLLMIVCLLFTVVLNAQDIRVNNYKVSSATELKSFEAKLAKNADWAKLVALATQNGLVPINAKECKFGFTGEWENLSTKAKSPARFFIVDLWNPKSKKGKGASLVYRQANGQTYMALCEYPEGQTNGALALDSCVETTVQNGKLVLAKSWSRCFRRCAGGQPGNVIVDVKGGKFNVPGGCGTGCLGSIAVCGGVTAILAVAAPPVSFFAAACTFGICAGVSCGVCFAVCALGCM
jgi:hypothetical protein